LLVDGGLFEGVDFCVVNGVVSSKGKSLKNRIKFLFEKNL
jgi:hypothetical protein